MRPSRRPTEQTQVLFSPIRWLIIAFVSALAAFALWFMAAIFVVHGPYLQVHAYAVKPPAVCPGAPVKTTIDRTLIRSPFLIIGTYDLYAKWINVATGQDERLPPSGGTLFDNIPGRLSQTSPILRAAPTTPGNWRLHIDMTLRGRVLGWPRDWPVVYESKDLLTVLSPTSEGCT